MALARRVDDLSQFLADHELGDASVTLHLASLRERLGHDKLVVAFVAEFSRGKSELINAIFFADTGRRILPATDDMAGGRLIARIAEGESAMTVIWLIDEIKIFNEIAAGVDALTSSIDARSAAAMTDASAAADRSSVVMVSSGALTVLCDHRSRAVLTEVPGFSPGITVVIPEAPGRSE